MNLFPKDIPTIIAECNNMLNHSRRGIEVIQHTLNMLAVEKDGDKLPPAILLVMPAMTTAKEMQVLGTAIAGICLILRQGSLNSNTGEPVKGDADAPPVNDSAPITQAAQDVAATVINALMAKKA